MHSKALSEGRLTAYEELGAAMGKTDLSAGTVSGLHDYKYLTFFFKC